MRYNLILNLKNKRMKLFLLLYFTIFSSIYLHSQATNCFTLLPYGSQTGSGPRSFASSDLNGDGKKDIVTANFLSQNISVLLGIGNGDFSPAVNYPAGTDPIDIIIDDFNGDSKPDVAVVNMSSDDLYIFPGTGSGGLGTPINKPLPPNSYPMGVTSGDVNNDGKRDIVVGHDMGISVFIGNGIGGFANSVVYPTSWSAAEVAVADLNSDGKADIVAATPANWSVDILMGDGSGTFPAFSTAVTGNSVYCNTLNIYDFNGDGILDILGGNGGSYTGYKVPLLRGNGDGTFAPPIYSTFPVGLIAGLVICNDFNKNNILDYAAVCLTPSSNYTLALRTGLGTGAFSPPVYYTLGNEPGNLLFDDFDNDGMTDIAICYGLNNFIPNIVQVYGNKYPSLIVTGSPTVCSGSSITLSASGASSYTWSTGSFSSSITDAPVTNTVYNVSAAATNGCKTSSAKTVSVISCNGLSKLGFEEKSISVYPNPSSGILEVKLTDISEFSLIRIYNLNGEQLQEYPISDGSIIRINREKIKQGMYFYEIVTDSKLVKIGKLIVQ